jgi:hypothetical protein
MVTEIVEPRPRWIVLLDALLSEVEEERARQKKEEQEQHEREKESQPRHILAERRGGGEASHLN